MIDDAFDGGLLAKETTYVGCFVAGTLVHTDKGRVPIQNIKVGDIVLSSPEQGNGSLREYKRVISTFKAESEEIHELVIRKRIYPEDEDDICHDIYEMIYLTGGHPIYVENSVFIEGWDSESDIDQINARSSSWQAARDLRIYDQIIVSNPKHGDGTGYEVVSIAPVQDVNRDYGFVSAATVDDNKPFDTIIYFNNEGYNIVGGDIDEGRKIKRDYFVGNYGHANYSDHSSIIRDFRDNYEKITASVKGYIADIPILRRYVYNFEVEDYHTYFVGEQGLWVHDYSLCSSNL